MCKILKPLEGYYRQTGGRDGRSYYCKPCNKDKIRQGELKRLYGITQGDYNRMFLEQEGRCAVCLAHQSERKRAFAVDHCHRTGAIRGLLCHLCNNSLGLLKDNAENFDRAAAYLRRFQ